MLWQLVVSGVAGAATTLLGVVVGGVLEAFVHAGELDEGEWRDVQRAVVEAQMAFVNAARRSLDPTQPELRVRVGGPLITDSSPVGGPP